MNRVRTTHRPSRATHYLRPGGPWDVPTLDALLSSATSPATPRPGTGPRDALVDGDIRLTADDLDGLAAGLAGGLRDLGVSRRDAVAWQLANGYESVLLYRACWRLGAVAVPIHHLAGAADVDRMLKRTDPVVTIGAAALPLGSHADAIIVGGPSLPSRGGTGSESSSSSASSSASATTIGGRPRHFAKLLAAEPELRPTARPSDVAVVLFTAGSTGEPKGVVHTHRSLATKALAMPARHGLTAADAVLMPAPLAHVSGLLNGVLLPGVVGMKSVLMPRWNTALALELIERERISFMVGPPTFFVGLLHDPGFTSRRVRSLRLVSTGGAGVTDAFAASAAEAFGATVKRAYGSTEAPTITTSGPGESTINERGTDGQASGDTELRIVDPSAGTDRAPGTEGELWVRGPELFAGYLDDEANETAFARGGWFRTGDLATLDDEGRLRITGRLKDIIIRGGENIAASEVEANLEAHPSVRHAVVLGVPDERWGERVAAFVETTGAPFDVAACRAWFAERGVARFKAPEQVIVLDALPVLPAGKPDRAALRRLLEPADTTPSPSPT
jgi:cyclohexanecarboxylate-CoA ligase